MERADFGKAADDYAKHRAGFPDSFFERMFRLGFVKPGDRLLDLGTGTGTLARGFAERGCSVVGLDPSRPMLDQAERLAGEVGLDIELIQASAEDTGLPTATFDLVIAGQCWHWFDRSRAANEAKRLLRSNGLLAIAHFDWLPLPGNVVAASEALIEAHNPKWTMGGSTGRYPQWARAVENADFNGIEIFDYDLDVPYSHEAWRGRIRASAGVGGTLAPDAVARFDSEHAALLAKDFPGDPLAIPHRVWAMTAVAPR